MAEITGLACGNREFFSGAKPAFHCTELVCSAGAENTSIYSIHCNCSFKIEKLRAVKQEILFCFSTL